MVIFVSFVDEYNSTKRKIKHKLSKSNSRYIILWSLSVSTSSTDLSGKVLNDFADFYVFITILGSLKF